MAKIPGTKSTWREVLIRTVKVLWLANLASYRQHLSFMGGMVAVAMLRERLHPLAIIAVGVAANVAWTFAEGMFWARRQHKALEQRFAAIQEALADAVRHNQPPPN